MTTSGVRTALDELNKTGEFIRTESKWRNWIKADGSTDFAPEAGRYHLYVSLACPWASRCLAFRTLKGLQDVISLSVVHPTWQRTKPDVETDVHTGWIFSDGDFPGTIPCPYGSKTIREVYERAGDTAHKYSVPVLWDKKTNTIVNNESAEIIRMFDTEFDAFAKNPTVRLGPERLRAAIEKECEWIYPAINNGVYRSGFAAKQEPYDVAVREVFDGLDKLEGILSTQRYVVGNRFTEADIRLFVTLVRFDEVYVVHFKCNKKRIADYPNILKYVRDVYQIPGIAETVNMDHIKTHYYTSHPSINPHGIVPAGPDVISDLLKPHDRDRFPAEPITE